LRFTFIRLPVAVTVFAGAFRDIAVVWLPVVVAIGLTIVRRTVLITIALAVVGSAVAVAIVVLQITLIGDAVEVAVVAINFTTIWDARSIAILRRFADIRDAIGITVREILAIIWSAIGVAIHLAGVNQAIRIAIRLAIVRNTVGVTVVGFQVTFVRNSIAVAIVAVELASVRNARIVAVFRRLTHIRDTVLIAIGKILTVIWCAIGIAVNFASVDQSIGIAVRFAIIGNAVGIAVIPFDFTTVWKTIAIAILGRLAFVRSSVCVTIGQTFTIIWDPIGVAVTRVFAGVGDPIAVTVLLAFVRNTIGITVVAIKFAAVRHT
jgi:hypothetical protein